MTQDFTSNVVCMVSKERADKLVSIAMKQLEESSYHKEPRMSKIKEYENSYAGLVKPKLRQVFNVPNVMFSGMIDTLESDFDDDISLKFEENDPADYLAVKKLNMAWKQEATSMRNNARWQLKMRWDKHLAILSGRGIQKTYAESTPEYKSWFDIVDYRYFHCEPKGGGNLENHLFCGEEGIFKTREQLMDGAKDGIYDSEQVKRIVQMGADRDYRDEVKSIYGDKLNRFAALGLNAESFNYVGQQVHNLCEWCLTYDGDRYYLLFDPWTREWVRVEVLEDVFSSKLFPWTSWATHEDPKVFWSKSFADDFWPISEAVKILLDQELTNREKQNVGAKAYDKRYFTDVAKLDSAQYRTDALVPANVPEGKSIQDGVYHFTTPELKGTVDLISWIEQDLGKHTGVSEIQSGAVGKGKGANVQYTLLQQAQKRIGHKSKAYVECYTEIGLRFMYGLVDHLTEPIAIKMIGKEGYAWDSITRKDLRMKKPFDVKIVNQIEEDKMNVLGKDQKVKALEMALQNQQISQQLNSKMVTEMLLKHVGGFEDDTINELMDLQNFGQRDVLAEADKAISLLIKGKTPKMVWNATTGFAQRILNYEKIYQEELGPQKSQMFIEYIQKHGDIIQQNMGHLAGKMKAQQAMGGQGIQGGPPQPPGGSQMPVSRQQQPMLARPAMSVGGGEAMA